MTSNLSVRDLFTGWDHFRGLSPEVLDALSDSSSIHSCNSYETSLVNEGSINAVLFILIEGSFRVEVEQNLVNIIDAPGDTVGEVSWITGLNATATVTAELGSKYLSFSFETLEKVNSQFNGELKRHLREIFPRIISKRLISTNLKAKAVTELIEKLRTTEESLRLMNENLGYQIARREREAFEQIQDIADKTLPKLLSYVTQNKKNLPSGSNAHSLLEEFDIQLTRMKVLLGGLAAYHPQEDFAAEIVDHQLGSREKSALDTVLSSFGLNQIQSTSLSGPSPKRILVSGSLDLSGLNSSDFYRRVLLVKNLNLTDLSGLSEFDTLIHFGCDSRSTLIRSLTAGLNKIVFGNIWGLHKYLSWGTKIYQSSINDSRKRLETIELVLSKLRESKVRNAVLSQIHFVLEELLMNAIYDAPTDGAGNPLYNHITRKQHVSLPDNKEVILTYGSDGITAGVAVIDPFGSLTKEILLSYLELGAKGIDAYDPSKGGAGKGLYLIVSNSSQTIFNIERGRKTEVICLFDLERKKQNAQDESASFHFYFK